MYENNLGDVEGLCCDQCAGLSGMGIVADTPTAPSTSVGVPWWQRAIQELEKIIPRPMSSVPSIPTFPSYPTTTQTPAQPAGGMFAPSTDWLTLGAIAAAVFLLTSKKRGR